MDESNFNRKMNELMRSIPHFILNGRRPEACGDLLRWARWFETAERHVQQTEVGEIWISTVFLGIDHRFTRAGPPILFETMCFVTRDDTGDSLPFSRYCTWEEAEAGHASAVEICRAVVNNTELAATDVMDKLKAQFGIRSAVPEPRDPMHTARPATAPGEQIEARGRGKRKGEAQ